MKARTPHKKVRLFLILVLVASASFGFAALKDKDFEIVKQLDIFYSLFNELNRFYVDETEPDKLIGTAIEGMLNSLDPYTSYIPEEDMADLTFMTTGEYGGIGALIRKGGDYAMVAEPYENFPAQLAGLRAGDTLVTINGVSTKGKDISTVSDLLKGTPNTDLTLQIKRIGSQNVIEKKLTRKKITIPNIPYSGFVADRIGYIRLTNFTKDAGVEAREALLKLKQEGATALILDLRGNPGGLLVESVNVSNLFVPRSQEIVSTRGKVKQWDNVYKTTAEPVDTMIPLVVLVNRGSASASEIVAGALQDLDRAVIVGQRTYGKGLVQTTRPLSYNSQLKVTTAKYYIPSGRCIQAVDYSNRNEDGSVGFIPDSLIHEFSTQNGRKVFDGGGIAPDIALEPTPVSNITRSLYQKNLIFDYATLYASRHETAPDLNGLQLSDADYGIFLDYLSDKQYDYTTSSDDQLGELIKVARQENYYAAAAVEFEALKKKLAHDKEKDLQTFSKEIKSLLYEEIASRFYYQKGRIQASLKDDPELNKAIEVLQDPKLYTAVLQPSYGSANARVGMSRGN
jgi:carboxyl-terminal processing protease